METEAGGGLGGGGGGLAWFSVVTTQWAPEGMLRGCGSTEQAGAEGECVNLVLATSLLACCLASSIGLLNQMKL